MSPRAARRAPWQLGEEVVDPGRRRQVELPIGSLVTGTPIGLRVQVLHGRREGPVAWLTAAIHGDEIQGVEIIRRVLAEVDVRRLAGTLLAIPVVNVHGFVTGDRYLPDRRDLNRSFPGSRRGSLAARIADVIMREVITGASFGIDLHTGAFGRSNLAQIRADLSDDTTRELAEVFGAPITIDARVRDGSLRQAATEAGTRVLLFEGGEALRFDEPSIAAGTAGVLRVLRHTGMLDDDGGTAGGTVFSSRSGWIRATRSGVVHPEVGLGDAVQRGEVVATVYGPHGERLGRLKTREDGVVIGMAQHPLVNRGDAVLHVATVPAASTRPGPEGEQ